MKEDDDLAFLDSDDSPRGGGLNGCGTEEKPSQSSKSKHAPDREWDFIDGSGSSRDKDDRGVCVAVCTDYNNSCPTATHHLLCALVDSSTAQSCANSWGENQPYRHSLI